MSTTTDTQPLAANKALVRSFFAQVDQRREPAVLDDFLAPDYVDHTPLPIPGLAPGMEGAKQAFAVNQAAFTDPWHRVDMQLAENNKVMTWIRAGGRHTGELLGIPPSGNEVTMTGVVIYRIAGDRLIERWGLSDLFGLFVQMGAVQPPGG